MGTGCSSCLPYPAPAAPLRGGAGRPLGGPVRGQEQSPGEILSSILAIERRCFPDRGGCGAPDEDGDENDLTVTTLLDEPDTRFCVCFSLESPVVIALLWARQPDVHIEDAWTALSMTEERRTWDGTSDYWLLREAGKDDVTVEEIYQTTLHPPWPFWDRDILKRQWRLPLEGPCGQGHALVSQSFDDDAVLLERSDRVRAFVHKAGSLLRPMAKASNGSAAAGCVEPSGIELTNCTQMDMGGLLPSWAQSVFAQFVVAKATSWAEALREHCIQKRAGGDAVVPGLSEISVHLPEGWSDHWDMTECPHVLDSDTDEEHADLYLPSGADAPTGWLV